MTLAVGNCVNRNKKLEKEVYVVALKFILKIRF